MAADRTDKDYSLARAANRDFVAAAQVVQADTVGIVDTAGFADMVDMAVEGQADMVQGRHKHWHKGLMAVQAV